MKKIHQDESGVALIMVMSALIILMALWGDFTFESKLSRIKTTNMLDKTQARLVAESGVELAMIRLRLFKEAYNMWENNENAKNSVPIQLINQLWEAPFIYPLPLPPNAGAQVKAAIDEFQKAAILEGELKLSIQNISNKLNLNMMRVSFLNQVAQQGGAQGGQPGGVDAGDMDGSGDQGGMNAGSGGGFTGQGADQDPNFNVEQQLARFLQLRLREKGEEDEAFREKYGSVDPLQLVANIKYYISDRNPRRQNVTQIDMLMDTSEQLFNEAKISAKYGPMTSFSEIYMIPGWDDALVEIIKSEFDVFPTVMIDLNKITANMLRILIPMINENEIREFFLFRDNPERPQFFNSLNDFKNYFVNIANVLNEASFDELFAKYAAQGIQFGSAPTLFRILSEGSFNNTSTTLIATVSMPQQQVAPQGGAQGGAQADGGAQAGAGQTSGAQGGDNSGSDGGNTAGAQGGAQGGKQNTQLLDPRIIEMEIN
jgi:hypothetical protein